MNTVKRNPVAMGGAPAPLASPRAVAEYYGLPEKTLAAWRSQGKGPTYRKYGRHVRYSWADVLAWEGK